MIAACADPRPTGGTGSTRAIVERLQPSCTAWAGPTASRRGTDDRRARRRPLRRRHRRAVRRRVDVPPARPTRRRWRWSAWSSCSDPRGALLDVQWITPHLASLGAVAIPAGRVPARAWRARCSCPCRRPSPLSRRRLTRQRGRRCPCRRRPIERGRRTLTVVPSRLSSKSTAPADDQPVQRVVDAVGRPARPPNRRAARRRLLDHRPSIDGDRRRRSVPMLRRTSRRRGRRRRTPSCARMPRGACRRSLGTRVGDGAARRRPVVGSRATGRVASVADGTPASGRCRRRAARAKIALSVGVERTGRRQRPATSSARRSRLRSTSAARRRYRRHSDRDRRPESVEVPGADSIGERRSVARARARLAPGWVPPPSPIREGDHAIGDGVDRHASAMADRRLAGGVVRVGAVPTVVQLGPHAEAVVAGADDRRTRRRVGAGARSTLAPTCRPDVRGRPWQRVRAVGAERSTQRRTSVELARRPASTATPVAVDDGARREADARRAAWWRRSATGRSRSSTRRDASVAGRPAGRLASMAERDDRTAVADADLLGPLHRRGVERAVPDQPGQGADRACRSPSTCRPRPATTPTTPRPGARSARSACPSPTSATCASCSTASPSAR